MSILSHDIYANLRTRVIVLSVGHILLVRNVAEDEAAWMPPGGGLEAHETLAECARREVHEETGLDVRVGRLAFVREWIVPRFAPSPSGDGWGYGLEVYLYATPRTPLPVPRPEEPNLPDPCWFPLGEVPALPLWPKQLKALCRRLAAGEQSPGSPLVIGRLESPWQPPGDDPFAADEETSD